MFAMLLVIAVVGGTAIVVTAVFLVLRREGTTPRAERVAAVSGGLLALWAIAATELAYRSVFQQQVGVIPAVGINMMVVLTLLAISIAASPTLRGLLSEQGSLIRLHIWRLEGALFLVLMFTGHLPALFAIPAGVGDVLIAVTAPRIARRIHAPGGRRRAVTWNLLGTLDLIVAVGLGMMTSPGPTQVVNTSPTSAFITTYPLVLIPVFLVPLALTLHVVSLWQLFFGTWRREAASGSRPASDAHVNFRASGGRHAFET